MGQINEHSDSDSDGAVGLTECTAALQRWMFSGPDMERVINNFENEPIAHYAHLT